MSGFGLGAGFGAGLGSGSGLSCAWLIATVRFSAGIPICNAKITAVKRSIFFMLPPCSSDNHYSDEPPLLPPDEDSPDPDDPPPPVPCGQPASASITTNKRALQIFLVIIGIPPSFDCRTSRLSISAAAGSAIAMPLFPVHETRGRYASSDRKLMESHRLCCLIGHSRYRL